MLEPWNFVRKFTHICSVREFTFQYEDPLNFADVSIFFAKNQDFLEKMVPLFKAITWEQCKRFFSSVFSFCKFKVTVIVNLCFTDYALEIRLLICSKLAINWKKHWCHSFPTWRHRQIFFKIVLFLLLSLVTGPSFMPISSLVLEL